MSQGRWAKLTPEKDLSIIVFGYIAVYSGAQTQGLGKKPPKLFEVLKINSCSGKKINTLHKKIIHGSSIDHTYMRIIPDIHDIIIGNQNYNFIPSGNFFEKDGPP